MAYSPTLHLIIPLDDTEIVTFVDSGSRSLKPVMPDKRRSNVKKPERLIEQFGLTLPTLIDGYLTAITAPGPDGCRMLVYYEQVSFNGRYKKPAMWLWHLADYGVLTSAVRHNTEKRRRADAALRRILGGKTLQRYAPRQLPVWDPTLRDTITLADTRRAWRKTYGVAKPSRNFLIEVDQGQTSKQHKRSWMLLNSKGLIDLNADSVYVAWKEAKALIAKTGGGLFD